jgi:hypothetical protein
VATGVVWQSHGVASFSIQPLVRQYGLIACAASTGSLLGARLRSVAVPGAIFGLGLLVALLVPGTHVRPFLLAGSGSFDFTFQRYSSHLLLLTVAAAGAAMLAAAGAPRDSRTRSWCRRGLSAALAALALSLVTSAATFGLVDVRTRQTCMQQVPRVCGPEAFERGTTEVGDIAREITSAVPPPLAATMPAELRLLRPGDVDPKGVGVEIQTPQLADPLSVAHSTIATLSGQTACIDRLPDSRIRDQVVGAAMVAGWVQLRTGYVVDGSYPSREVARLRRLPEAEQVEAVTSLAKQVWACRGVDLGAFR